MVNPGSDVVQKVATPGRVLLLLATREEQARWTTRRLLRRAGLTAEQFAWATLEDLREQSPENPRLPLTLQCKAERVSVVVPMGEDALYELLGTSELLRWFHRAVPHSEFGWVVPNFAPSKLLPFRADDADAFDEDDIAGGKRRRRKAKGLRHPPRFTGVAAATLHKALRIAREGLPPAPEINYLLDPQPARFREWAQGYFQALAADPTLVLSRDCETAYHLKGQGDEDADLGIDQDKRIIRMSFAYREDEGVSVPFEGPYVSIIVDLLASPGPKVGANNWAFDSIVEELNGLTLNGRDYDSQDAWHMLQSDLDKGLEFVSAFYTRLMPWKHTSTSQADLYAAIDAVAAMQNFNGIKRDLIAADQWDLYERHAVDLHPILVRASKRGVMIDQKLRGELREEFRLKLYELLLEAQGMVPHVNQRFHPYVRKPKDAVGEWEEIEVTAKRRLCLVCEKPNVNRRHACKVMPEGWDPQQHLGYRDETAIRHINVAPAEGCTLEQLEKWLTKNGFNPNSSTQLLNYMRFYRHPVGFNHKTEEDSADNKHLKRLVKQYGAKHPIYPQTVTIHLVQKALSQYVEGIVPDAEGLVHTTYVNGPSTWRLASRGPNLQNISKRAGNPYAAKTRRMFVARPGHVFVQCDSTSVESVMVGYDMGDEDYIALAKRSLPAYLVAWKRGIVKTKAEYFDLFDRDRAKIMELKKDALYDPLKITNHGCFTPDHEVLTPTGWQTFADYSGQAPIAIWDPSSKAVRWEVPAHLHRYTVDEQLYALKGRALSAVTTAHHRWPFFCGSPATSPLQEKRSEELGEARQGRIPVVGVHGLSDARVSDVALSLMVAIQADGTILKDAHVGFHFKKTRKIERLRDLLVGRRFTERHYGQNTYFYVPHDEIYDALMLLTSEKDYDLPFLLTLSERQRHLVLDESLEWDGSKAGAGQRVYFTSRKQNAEALQTIAHTSGRQALLRQHNQGKWTLSYNRRQHARAEVLEIRRQDYKGTVHCVTVSTGYFLYRHNDRVAVTGNSAFGATPYLLHMSMAEVFPTLALARDAQRTFYAALPGLQKYQHQKRVRAQKEQKLRTNWGIVHHFYDVFTYQLDDDGRVIIDPATGLEKIKLGKDGNRAVAFTPQSSNGSFQRDNVNIVGRSPWAPYMPASLTVHDSLKLEVPEKLAEDAAYFLLETMTRSVPELDGLRIGAECEIGNNWKDLEHFAAWTTLEPEARAA